MWLRLKASEVPRPGTNVFIITHLPNIAAAFGSAAVGFADGEALVIRPGTNPPDVIGRITIAAWPKLNME